MRILVSAPLILIDAMQDIAMRFTHMIIFALSFKIFYDEKY